MVLADRDKTKLNRVAADLPRDRTLARVANVSKYKHADYRPLAGNYVMVEGKPGVALYAHLKQGSVAVRDRDSVTGRQSLKLSQSEPDP